MEEAAGAVGSRARGGLRRGALLAQRLAAQALTAPAATVAEACRRLFGLQAQDLVQARWALGVRCEAATAAAVDEAFAGGEVVRGWTLRGTLHLHPAEELPWLVALLGARNLARAAGRLRQLDITARDVASARRLAERALGARPLGRQALLERLEQGGQAVGGQRGVHLLYCLTQHGVLCQAGEDFALAEAWIPRPRRLHGDEALAELARRYRAGHGPATEADLAAWTGLSLGVARRAWALAGPPPPPAGAGVPGALLLPGYDEYLLGYADRSAQLEARHFQRVVPGGNGVFRPMLVLEGRVLGTWSRRLERGRATVTLTPFVRLGAARRRAVERAAGGLGRFLGAPVRVELAAP